jgi:hypothetical protein
VTGAGRIREVILAPTTSTGDCSSPSGATHNIEAEEGQATRFLEGRG